MSNSFKWAIDKDGNLSKCRAKKENIGKGNCPHIIHQSKDETTDEFMNYYNKLYTEIDGEVVLNPSKNNKAILTPHNRDAYIEASRILETQDSCAIVQPTGTGKSAVFGCIADDYKDENILLVVPKSKIGEQFLDHDRIEGKGQIESITYKMIHEHYHPGEIPAHTFEKVVKNFDSKDNVGLIMLDEVHRSGAEEWSKAVEEFIKYTKTDNGKVVGASATPDRVDGFDVIGKFCGGRTAGNLTFTEAIKNGILPMPNYISVPISIEEEFGNRLDKIEKLKSLSKHSKNELIAKTMTYGKDQISKQKTIDDVFEEELLDSIINKIDKNGEGTKIVVFLSDRKDVEKGNGIKIRDSLTKSLKDQKVSFGKFYTGTGNADYNAFKEKVPPGEVRVLYTVEMFSEGIHMNGVDTIIMSRDTNSSTLYHQQIGRVLDINKAANKETPMIIDTTNNFSKFVNWSNLEASYKANSGDNNMYFKDKTNDLNMVLRDIDLDIEEATPRGNAMVGIYNGTRTNWEEILKFKPYLEKEEKAFRTYVARGHLFEEAIAMVDFGG